MNFRKRTFELLAHTGLRYSYFVSITGKRKESSLKTQKRNQQATIREALVVGKVPTYGEMAAMTGFIFAVMFAVMGFINADKLEAMGTIGFFSALVLGFVWVGLTRNRTKQHLTPHS